MTQALWRGLVRQRFTGVQRGIALLSALALAIIPLAFPPSAQASLPQPSQVRYSQAGQSSTQQQAQSLEVGWHLGTVWYLGWCCRMLEASLVL